MKKTILPALFVLMLASCNVKEPGDFAPTNKSVEIYPDYSNLALPVNIAPLNFTIDLDADAYFTKIHSKKGAAIKISGKNILFKERKWKKLLSENKGDTLYYEIFIKKGDKWTKYPTIKNFVANEPIDNYLVYRLIEPGYILYDHLSIQQRDITSFDENAVYDNRMVSTESRGQCINCHSFQDYNRSGKIQMHFRSHLSGTIIANGNKLNKVNLKTDSTLSGGVYPTWHPKLDLIVYSVNSVNQNFHTKDLQKVEVLDLESGLILYNIAKNEVSTIVDSPYAMETYPYWAPDGKSLYYASADYVPKHENLELDISENYNNIKYNLFKIPFNTQTLEFGEPDTVYNAAAIGKSATLPRPSPNGKYLMFTMADYGNFHIWHKTSDLYLINLETGETSNIKKINSPNSESYHSWSSNSNWVVYSTRRQNGAYTRFYLSYFDAKGNFHKPFVLPQKSPQFDQQFFKSFNVPEFISKPVAFSPHQFAKALKTRAKIAVYGE